MIYTALNYLKYNIIASYKYGHGIHSPFLYDFIVNVLNDKRTYFEYKEIENEIKKLKDNENKIIASSFGAKVFDDEKKTISISDLTKKSSVPLKYRKLLFRVVRYYQPKQILELGTCLGVSTAYLSKGNNDAQILSVEAHEPYIKIAKELFNNLNISNVKVICNTFENVLTEDSLETFDLIFFDGNHTYEATTLYFNQCLKHKNNNTIFIFDDIYWSKPMSNAWKYIVQNNATILTIDLFRFGIVFFNENIFNKQHYIIRF